MPKFSKTNQNIKNFCKTNQSPSYKLRNDVWYELIDQRLTKINL